MANEKRLICVEDFKKNLCHYCNTHMEDEPCEPNECWVWDVIAQTDTVDAVEVVRGRWKAHKPDCRGYAVGFICSCCGDIIYADYSMKECVYNYCPNCGAKMDKTENP